MKLFVWADPYPVSYGSSLFFAVAETVEQARKIAAKKALQYSYGKYLDNKGESGMPVLLGDPDRIIKIPGGEWHRWQE